MKSHFNFKSLFSRLPNVSIPKEFIYFGIGAVLVVLIGLIAGNMYLQEMLFFEGHEKSLQMFTEEELREYGELYKELALNFQNEIGLYVEGYARREGSGAKDFVNRAGERVHYGIYNHEHPTDDPNLIKKHSNGRNEAHGDGGYTRSDIDDSFNSFSVEDSYLDTDEYKNGITIKYSKTEGRTDGESNFKDILTVVSMLIDQKQSDDTYHTEDGRVINLKEKVPKLIENLFKMSHTYTGTLTDLYPCNKGCRVLFYYCNEDDNEYVGTGINLKPFEINPHSDFDEYEYEDEDFELFDSEGECEICKHNGKGCIEDSHLCFHGTEHSMGRSLPTPDTCTNWRCHPACEPPPNADEHECGVGEPILDGEENQVIAWNGEPLVNLGCAGFYECLGHKHWNCKGHFYVCCMGHRDITVKVKIMYLEEMLEVIKNGYNPES